MNYLSVKEIAVLWKMSERSVRNYCARGRIPGAFLTGKTWNIPENAEKPDRKGKSAAKRTLLSVLQEEKSEQLHGGIYHKVQIELTYNSNRIEGSRLTHDQTRYIFVQIFDPLFAKPRLGAVDDLVDTAKMIDRFNNIVHADALVGDADGGGFIDIAGLVVGEAVALDAVGIVGQFNLNFMIDPAADLSVLFLLQNRKQGARRRFFVTPFGLLCGFGDVPSLAGEERAGNAACRAVIPNATLRHLPKRRDFFDG